MGRAASRSGVVRAKEGPAGLPYPSHRGREGVCSLGIQGPPPDPFLPRPWRCLGDLLGWGGVGGQETFPRSSQLVRPFLFPKLWAHPAVFFG